MRKTILLLLAFYSVSFLAYAEDVATYSGSTYTGCRSIGDTNYFLTNPNDYSSIKPGYIYLPNGCGSLPQVPSNHLKIVSGAVVEMSQAEKDAVDQTEADAQAQALLTSSRSGAKNSVDQLSPEGVRLRSALLVSLDEINNLRGWIESFKAQVALASSLADLKTRVAGLPSMPDRTATQVKTAIKGKIDDGSAD